MRNQRTKSAPRYTPRRQKPNLEHFIEDHKGALVGAPLIGLSIALVAGVTFATEHLRYERELDPTTLCSVNRPVTDATIVLVDRTDPLTLLNAPRFQRLIAGLGQNATRGSRLQIIPFSDDVSQPLTAIFDVCSPGRGRDANPWTESRVLTEENYAARFDAPLQAAIETLTQASVAPNSPITRQIERVARDRALWPEGSRRTLIIASDFLENPSSGASIYKSAPLTLAPPREQFLQGIEIQIVELANARDADLQDENLRTEWEAWFRAAGATIEEGPYELGAWES